MAEKVTISAEDFGLLMYCAVSYDRRLPNGSTPVHLWDFLPQGWRDRINGAGCETRWEEQSAGDRLLDALSRSSTVHAGDWRPLAERRAGGE